VKLRTLLLALVVLTDVGLLTPPAASAAPTSKGKPLVTFGIGPAGAKLPDNRPYLTFGVTPGTTVLDNVAVFNQSDSPLSLLVYPGDALNSAGGGLDITKRSARNTDLGSWVTLGKAADKAGLDPTSRSQTTVVVPPQGRRGVGFVIVPVRIAVPADASPGDHVGGIAVSLITQGNSPTAQNIELEQRVVTRIYLQVAGDLKPALGVKVLGASYAGGGGLGLSGDVKVRYRITNTGNTRLGADARVHVKGLLGVGSRTVDGPGTDELVPGGSVDLSATVQHVPPTVFASAKVSVEATAPPGAEELEVSPASASARIWAVTWQELLLLLVVLLAAGGGTFHRRRVRRNPSLRGKHTAGSGTGKRIKPTVGVRRSGLALVAALVAGLVSVLGAGSASAAASLGPVFVEPQSGTDATLFHGAVGEARCPAGTDGALFDILGEDIGDTAPEGSKDLGFLGQPAVDGVGTVEFGNNAIANLKTTNTGAFSHSGTYRIRLRCQRGAELLATYETTLVYTAGGAGSWRVVGNGKRPTTPAALPTDGPGSVAFGTGAGVLAGAAVGAATVTPAPGAATPAASSASAASADDAGAPRQTPTSSATGTAEKSQSSPVLLGGLAAVAGLLVLAWLGLGRRRRGGSPT
jgi:hypothetical protein